MSTTATKIGCAVENASSEHPMRTSPSSHHQTLLILSRIAPKVFPSCQLSNIQREHQLPSNDSQKRPCLGIARRSGLKGKTQKITRCGVLPPIVKLTRSERSNRTRWTYVHPEELPASVKAIHAQSKQKQKVETQSQEQESKATYVWNCSEPPAVSRKRNTHSDHLIR
ncbi:hypothetical protein CPB83DRAFT_907178 [Crepidotus variabilis]|uniref:Uncharacterized protein n=1 Tax=Crepidotus variabilis TaxID=179855 RepID=A0A9P6EF95_9AGAR|nr:hypothetical protein CPB83DRAFT_907178 [Crepidotus variabilis]